jgi:hypothetical protein
VSGWADSKTFEYVCFPVGTFHLHSGASEIPFRLNACAVNLMCIANDVVREDLENLEEEGLVRWLGSDGDDRVETLSLEVCAHLGRGRTPIRWPVAYRASKLE